MSMSAKSRIVSVLLVGVVLAGYLSHVAGGMLVCIGDGTAPDCCRNSKNAHQSRPGEAKQMLAGADCDCCIAVDAIPSTAGTPSYKSSLDAVAGPAHFRNVVLPSSTRLPHAMSGNRSDARLSSLRTVVLLI